METTVSALRRTYWDARVRWLVFALAASSIACLLADFYALCPMRIFTPFIFLPALLALFASRGWTVGKAMDNFGAPFRVAWSPDYSRQWLTMCSACHLCSQRNGVSNQPCRR